jgi:peptide deformylase
MKHKLVYYGNQTLAKVAQEVDQFTPEIQDLVQEMFEILEQSKGVGLAAPQIDVSKRIIVIDISHVDEGPKIALVNPKIVQDSGDEFAYEEGCLSIPGIWSEVIRPGKISVEGFTPAGKAIAFDADGMFARVLQHEIDHLNGILFIDRIEESERKEFVKELKQIKKLNKGIA